MRVGMEERFWSKVNKGEEDECWLWTACKFRRGYGAFSYNKKLMRAHRVSLIIAGHDVPDGVLVCHRCDNPSCVNPKHLFLGTSKDNTQDMILKGRKASRKGVKQNPEKTIKGVNHGRAKLTEDQVVSVRKMCDDGTPQSKIAKLMGVSQTCVSKIHRRLKWRHL